MLLGPVAKHNDLPLFKRFLVQVQWVLPSPLGHVTKPDWLEWACVQI